MNHRRPPLPVDWASERGICRWCGCCIVYERGPNKGKPNYKRWHSRCVTEYQEIFWPQETIRMLIKERGRKCEDCGTERYSPELHHIIPLIDYQHDPSDPYAAWKRENLVLLCHNCHVGTFGRHAKIREAKQPQLKLNFGES